MKDRSHDRVAALTMEEARALSTPISDVVRQRDELLEEVQYWCEVMAELAGLRQFLDDDPAGPVLINSTSNGHLASACGLGLTTLPAQADTTSVADLDAEHDDISATSQPKPETPAVVLNAEARRHTGETPADDRRSEAKSPAGTLMARILRLIEQSDRPKRPWQVQKELNLPRMPSAELSRLVAMGWLTRPKEGIYAIPGRDYGGSVPTEGG